MKSINRIVPLDSLKGNHELLKGRTEVNSKRRLLIKNSLMKNGQLNPLSCVGLFIIDGRARAELMFEIDIKDVMIVEYDENLTEDEIMEIIETEENRRHQTKTQLACNASLYYLKHKSEKGTTLDSVVLSHEVTKRNLGYANYIFDNRKDIFELLRRGEPYTLSIGVPSDSLKRVADDIRAEIKSNLSVKTNDENELSDAEKKQQRYLEVATDSMLSQKRLLSKSLGLDSKTVEELLAVALRNMIDKGM